MLKKVIRNEFLLIMISSLLLFSSVSLQGSNKPSAYSETGQVFNIVAVWGSPQSTQPLLAAPSSSSLPLSITLYDLGPASPIYAITASFSPSSPLTPVSGEPQSVSQYLPEMTSGQSINMIGFYDVSPNATAGVYPQQVTVSYSNGTAVFNQTVQFTVPILGSSHIALSGFLYNPAFIYPGTPLTTLQVYLENTGSATASNVNLNLSTSFPISAAYPGSTSDFLGFLPVGTPVPVTFVLTVANTSSPVNTSLTLEVNYNQGKSETLVIPFTEHPKAILQVQPGDMQSIKIGDSADYVTFEIENTGTVAAQYTLVTLLPSNVFSPSIPSSESPLLALTAANQSAGTILPGQTANITYIVRVSSSIKQGTYPLNLLLTWRQPNAVATFAQQSQILISVHRTLMQSFATYISTQPMFVAVIILVVALIAVGTFAARKSGRRDDNSSRESDKT